MAALEPGQAGPYQVERDTYDTPLYVAWRDLPLGGIQDLQANSQRSRDLKLRYLLAQCETSRVELGAFDERILTWLAGCETSTVQVVIGLIARAHAAGYALGTPIGTNTGHGHVWERPDGAKLRCGGPALCRECREFEALLAGGEQA
jgi:hypothetical protein